MTITDSFENGNGRATIEQDGTVVLSPRPDGKGKPVWLHVALDNVDTGRPLRLRIDGLHPGSGPVEPVYSRDGVEWLRAATAGDGYAIEAPTGSMRLALNIPYTVSDMETLRTYVVKEVPEVEVFNIARSREGRPVPCFKVPAIDGARNTVWIHARLHAFESHASRVADELVRLLTYDANRKRFANTDIFVTPLVDVDCVFNGDPGKDQAPVDFNRDWTTCPQLECVRAMQDLMRTQANSAPVALMLDLHCPWYTHMPHFYACLDLDRASIMRFHGRFTADLAQGPDPLEWGPDFNWWAVETKQLTGTSTQWTLGPDIARTGNFLCFTIEIPHWKDFAGRFIEKKHLGRIATALVAATEDHLRPAQ